MSCRFLQKQWAVLASFSISFVLLNIYESTVYSSCVHVPQHNISPPLSKCLTHLSFCFFVSYYVHPWVHPWAFIDFLLQRFISIGVAFFCRFCLYLNYFHHLHRVRVYFFKSYFFFLCVCILPLSSLTTQRYMYNVLLSNFCLCLFVRSYV